METFINFFLLFVGLPFIVYYSIRYIETQKIRQDMILELYIKCVIEPDTKEILQDVEKYIEKHNKLMRQIKKYKSTNI